MDILKDVYRNIRHGLATLLMPVVVYSIPEEGAYSIKEERGCAQLHYTLMIDEIDVKDEIYFTPDAVSLVRVYGECWNVCEEKKVAVMRISATSLRSGVTYQNIVAVAEEGVGASYGFPVLLDNKITLTCILGNPETGEHEEENEVKKEHLILHIGEDKEEGDDKRGIKI